MDKIQQQGAEPELLATSAQDFFALAEKRIRDDNGSGYAEWGKQRDDNNAYGDLVNQGMFTLYYATSFANSITLGLSDNEVTSLGVSRTKQPLINVNGVHHRYYGGDLANSWLSNKINFPPAPDGTKTYDSATGIVVQHADSATAFAAETATNKVITSRQDYCFLESWHEKISDSGKAFPLGNVQYGASSWEGVPLSRSYAQGYSAFGEWDSDTHGYCADWGSLTDEQKLLFIQDPENNIYAEDGELIHVRYRARAIEGLGDDWALIEPHMDSDGKPLGYSSTNGNVDCVTVRGDRVTSEDYGRQNNSQAGRYHDQWSKPDLVQTGMFRATAPNGGYDVLSTTAAHNGLCFAIPIALVQRRNQGVWDGDYNPYGCDVATGVIASTEDCFNPSLKSGVGDIASGISGRPDGYFYDAILADDVEDLRMSSRRVPLAEIHDKARRESEEDNPRRMPVDIDALGEALHKSGTVRAINSVDNGLLIKTLTGSPSSGTDAPEDLTITKVVDDVVSHTPSTITPDVLYTTQLESENGVAKLVFNVDDSGVIDGSNAKSFKTQFFIVEG